MTQDQSPQPPAAPSPAAEPSVGNHPAGGPFSVPKAGRPWPRAIFWMMLALLASVVAAMLILPGYSQILWHEQRLATPAEAFRSAFPWLGIYYIAPNLFEMMRNPWTFPVHSALGLLAGGALLAALFGLGFGALSLVRPWRRMLPRLSERAALALPVAAVPVSLAVLGLGLAGLANPAAYGMLLALLLILAAPGWVRFLGEMRRGGWRAFRQTLRAQPRLVLILLGLILLIALVYTLSPATESDELRYHLAAPATWLREGRIHYLPWQAFSNFPMLGEMLFLMARALGGDEAAKLIHFAFLPVCMMLIGLTALRLRNCGFRIPHSAFLAGAAFALIPMVPILAGWGFIDMFVVAYFMAFVYLAGRALVRPGRASGSLLGLIVGGGIGVKYTLVWILGGLGAVWAMLLYLSPTGRRRPNRLIITLAGCAFLAGGAWYLKNTVWTGNPVYPGAWSIFHGGEWSQENSAFFRWKSQNNAGWHLSQPAGMGGKGLEFLITPLTTTFYSDFFEQNPLGPLPLLALLLGLGWFAAGKRLRALNVNISTIRRSPAQRRFRRWIVLATILSWVAWFPSYQSNRFLLPTAALLLALAAPALAGWMVLLPRGLRRLLNSILALAALQAFLFTLAQVLAPWDLGRRQKWELTGTTKADAIAVALGFEDRDFYLAHRLNYWHAAQWLARRARPGEKALLIGEHRTMHFNLPLIASDWFDTPQPLPFLRSTPNNDATLDRLRASGVRYLFLNQGELRQQYPLFLKRFLNNAETARFQALLTHPRLKPIYPYDENIVIYQIE